MITLMEDKMCSRLTYLLIFVCILIFHSQIYAGTVTITSKSLNVRSGPGRTYDVVDIVNKDEKFEILQEKEGWYQISVEGILGWVSGKGIANLPEEGIQELLNQADRYFYRQQFTTPPEANAYDLYRQVLQQDPQNSYALKKMAQMTRTYKVWADTAREKGDSRRAKVYYQRYLFLRPDDQEAQTLLKNIENVAGSSETALRIVRLRTEPDQVSKAQILRMIRKYSFHHPADWSKYGLSASITGNFRHDYEPKRLHEITVLIDYATRLMWQQKGPENPVNWQEAFTYIAQLNAMRYAGYSDWRLPTIEELASLLEPEKVQGNLYLASVFGTTPLWCWSADRASNPDTAWYISFNSGGIQQHTVENTVFVLAVRTYE